MFAVSALLDSVEAVRRSGAQLCGAIGVNAAFGPLSAASDDSSAPVRREVALALGALGDTTAVDTVVRLASDSVQYVRAAAIEALVALGARWDVVISAAGNYDGLATLTAIKVLGSAPGSLGFELLLTVADSSTSAKTRQAAIGSLGQTGLANAAQTVRNRMIEDDDPAVREAAAGALAAIGTDMAVPDLLTALRAEPDPYVRSAIADALGLLAAAEAVEVLEEVRDRDTSLAARRAAQRALSRIRSASQAR
jgi:HEAT repeat protein